MSSIPDSVKIARPDHPISRKNISENALKVLYRLKDAGYSAQLVGGGVRDLLLDMHPKDFDVATEASPEEVKAVFRNCRLIGRRFRLAHIHFGREIIEVATYRASHDGDSEHGQAADCGMLVRDNVYGTLEEDAWRRDFSVNALYYDISDFSIIDYTGGMQDIAARRLRLLGDPEKRYREDPVRMLRAVRFACKLDFDIEPDSDEFIRQHADILEGIPAARLFDEVLKLLMAGKAQKTLEMLRDYGLFRPLFPVSDRALQDAPEFANEFIRLGMRNTDVRIGQGKPVTPAFLYAVLLWEPVRTRIEALVEEGMSPHDASFRASEEAIAAQLDAISIPRRFSTPMREIWTLQYRFSFRKGQRPKRLLAHPRFRAAYDFLVLRAESGEADPELAQWWTDYQEGKQVPSAAPKKRRRRRRKKPASATSDG